MADRERTDALASAVAGDELAFRRLIVEHHEDMRRICLAIAGDRGIADEAVQAAWLVAARKLGQVHGPAQLRPWLVSVAVKEAKQILRRRRRLAEIEGPADASDLPGGIDPATGVAAMDLRAALARLDPDDAALLAMRYIAGFDSNELADRDGHQSVGHAQSHRATAETTPRGSPRMDDLTPFERQVAREMVRRAGPEQPVDDTSIYAAVTTAAQSPRRRMRSLHRVVRSRSTDDRPAPIAATNGQTPAAAGRTQIIVQPSQGHQRRCPRHRGRVPHRRTVRSGGRHTPGRRNRWGLPGPGGRDGGHPGPVWAPRSVGTDEPTDRPAYADLTGVTVSVDGERLTVRFDAAEAIPEVPDPSGLPFAYILYIETDGDAGPDWDIYAEYANGSWYSSLFDIGDGETSILGEAAVIDGAVTASAGLDALPVSPSEMRFRAVTHVFDRHDPDDILDVIITGDRVPDDEDDWRALGESDAVATSG